MAAWLLSASGCAWMDNKQRLIIYRPTVGIPADFAGLRVGDERYFVDVPNALDTRPHRIQLWWLPHPDANAPTLLYFHGTFRNLFQNSRKIEALRDAGFAVLAVDYRGWGLSTPITPSEQTILKDADVAWTELQRREPRASQRVIYGHSMGSGVAVDLASRLRAPQDFGGVILESAITSFTDVAREAGLLARLAASFNNERFASIEKITSVHAPLLMIHGSADKTIPMHLGEKLFAAANPPKTWLTLEGGNHSNLDSVDPDSYQAALKNFRWRHIAPR
jgi:pimeloyl-ACP methyl ester carboxylesterase